jgi:hypothetical protein
MSKDAAAEGQSVVSGLARKHGFSFSVAALGVILLVLIHRSVYAYLLVGNDYTIDMSTLRVADRPDWAGDALVSEIRTTGPLTGKMSIFDPDLVKNVSDHYAANPWVSRVLAVEKEFPNSLRVRVEMRKPLFAVEQKGQFILVDRDRVRIPGSYAQVPKFSFSIPRALGVRTAAPDAGKRWEDPAVEAAAEVSAALLDNRIDRQISIAAIDVSRVGKGGRESEIVILAEQNVAIEWGRSTAGGAHGELPAEEKVLNLKGVLMSQPRLKGVTRVKVQFDDPVVVTGR